MGVPIYASNSFLGHTPCTYGECSYYYMYLQDAFFLTSQVHKGPYRDFPPFVGVAENFLAIFKLV